MPRSRSAGSRPGFRVHCAGPTWLGETQAFEFGGAADHQPAELGIFAGAARTQVGYASTFVRDFAERAIETGPALRPDLALEPGADFLFASWSQLKRHPFRRAGAKAVADVVAADDQILAVVGAAADQHVNVRVVGIPVIDGDPVEAGPEVALGVLHQFAGEGAKVGHLGGVLRRDGEAEMMPVLVAAFGERLRVGVIGGGVEHPGVRAVAGDAVAFQIGDMFRERRRTKAAAVSAHDPGHDDDAPAGRAGRKRQRRPPSPAEGRATRGPAASLEGRASVAGLLRGPHHLGDEALRSLRAPVAGADAAGARIEVVVPRGHGRIGARRSDGWRSEA